MSIAADADAAAAAAASSDVFLQKEMITLCLPPLSDSDPLFPQKKRLWDSRNLKFEFHIPVPSTDEDVLHILNHIVRSARILHLDEVEIYFAEDDDCGPFCPRNELESLNSILLIIDSSFPCTKSDGLEVLQVLKNATVSMINCVGAQYIDSMIVKWVDTDAEESLMKWGKDHGVRTKLKIAYFEEAGRGAIASEDINIGDIALEIPKSLIISEDLVLESDMFDVLRNLEGITCETMLLLWSMRERYNSNSRFKNYFEALPECFNTDFDVSCAEDDTSQCQSGETGLTSHMIRGTWFSKSIKPHTYHLPSPLLAHLRAVLKGSDFEMDPGESIQEEIERSVLETVISIFTPMMEALGDSDEVDREDSNWDVKLALDYKDLQRRIISSILASCTAGLRELNGS